MHTEHDLAVRRIEIAKARLDTWTEHQRALQLEPADLEDLAARIEEAEEAVRMASALGHALPVDRARLRAAMEDLRMVTELLGRGIAGRARVGGFRDVRTGTRRKAGDVGGRGGPARTVTRYFPRPEVVGIAQAADGSVELAIECPKLERDRKLYLEVRRRAGQSGEYRAIGRTRDTRFVDPAPYEGGATAAYKVVARRGMRSGPHSRRAQVVLSSASIREARAALRQARSAGGDRVLAAAA